MTARPEIMHVTIKKKKKKDGDRPSQCRSLTIITFGGIVMSTLCVKRFGHLPPVIGVVLQPIPGVVHPKVSACLESLLLCYQMNGSGLF